MAHFERFLAACLSAEWDELERSLEAGLFSESGLVDALKKNRLAGWLAFLLRDVKLPGARLRSLRDRLRSDYAEQWSAAENNVRRLETLDGWLDGELASAVVLKGPLMAHRYWGAIEARRTQDIDLLIPRSRLAEFETRLHRRGFRGLHSSRLLYALLMHHYDLQSADGSVIELHTDLRRHLGCFEIDYEKLFERTERHTLGDRRYRVLSLDYDLTFQSLIVFDDIVFKTDSWKEAVDLYSVLRRAEASLDWEGFLEEKKRERVDRIVFGTIDLVLSRLDRRDDFPRFYRVQDASKLRSRTNVLYERSREAWIEESYSCSAARRRLWLSVAKHWDEGSRLLLPVKNAKRRFL